MGVFQQFSPRSGDFFFSTFSAVFAAKRRKFFSALFQQFSPRSGGFFQQFPPFSALFQKISAIFNTFSANFFFSTFSAIFAAKRRIFFSNFSAISAILLPITIFQQFHRNLKKNTASELMVTVGYSNLILL